MRARTVALAVLVLGAAAVVGAWRTAAAREARREAAVETSRVRAWARSSTAAGISVVPKRVPEADERELRRLDALPGFHEYAMRCSSCHVLPDPGAYRPGQWTDKVEEMRWHIGRAGVMPPAEEELAAVRRFLHAASDSLRAN